MCPTSQDEQLPQDDETRRLLAAFEACRAKELAGADQLSKPRRSMLYPASSGLYTTGGCVWGSTDKVQRHKTGNQSASQTDASGTEIAIRALIFLSSFRLEDPMQPEDFLATAQPRQWSS